MAPSAEDGGGGGFKAPGGTSSIVPRKSTAKASDWGDQSPLTHQTRSWDGASNLREKSSTTALEAGTGGKVLWFFLCRTRCLHVSTSSSKWSTNATAFLSAGAFFVIKSIHKSRCWFVWLHRSTTHRLPRFIKSVTASSHACLDPSES